jgi:hypothetical protein
MERARVQGLHLALLQQLLLLLLVPVSVSVHSWRGL